jgi:hypothetical protein
MKYILSLIFLIFLAKYSFAQDCTDYHKYHCLFADYSFFYSEQSKSALFRKGQTSEFKIVINEGEDYYIAVCAHRKFGDLHFKILEDNEDSTLIYENAEHDYTNSVIFTNEVTRNIIVEVSVPGGLEKGKIVRRCVGVLVQYRKTEPEKAEPLEKAGIK